MAGLQFRQRVRQEFEKHKDVRDPQIIDVLLLKGRNELTETLNQWKMHDHVFRFFPNSTYAQPQRKVRPDEDDSGRGKHSEFLARFYEGNFSKERLENYS
ncbi:NADH dehydrogenase 1 alpha subcomplex subunit 6 ndufa6 [Borealophlyctis nickersoniae]|nr:NADH dehydrogenase 1 alpha subcomplex subunit 6 ndufa6 [Borealophlyctis nickersoniae]